MRRHTTIKICALGAALAAGVVTGQAGQVQATPRTVTAGPVVSTGKHAPVGGEAVKWEPGTYRVRYQTAEITAYCPLDVKGAVKGVDYMGDRTIGANGKKVIPGLTVAAPKSIPFGTEIFINGYGRKIVSDRGARIVEKGNAVCIDLCVQTREQALQIGRRRVPMIILERVIIHGD